MSESLCTNNNTNCIVYYYNGVQNVRAVVTCRIVGRMDRALISFGLALCLRSASLSSVFIDL